MVTPVELFEAEDRYLELQKNNPDAKMLDILEMMKDDFPFYVLILLAQHTPAKPADLEPAQDRFNQVITAVLDNKFADYNQYLIIKVTVKTIGDLELLQAVKEKFEQLNFFQMLRALENRLLEILAIKKLTLDICQLASDKDHQLTIQQEHEIEKILLEPPVDPEDEKKAQGDLASAIRSIIGKQSIDNLAELTTPITDTDFLIGLIDSLRNTDLYRIPLLINKQILLISRDLPETNDK